MFIAQYFATCVKGIANETTVKKISHWTSPFELLHIHIFYIHNVNEEKSNNLQVDKILKF